MNLGKKKKPKRTNISIVSARGGRNVSPKLTVRMLYLCRKHIRYGNGCYGLCAWLPGKNIDLVLKGCGHILGSLPIVMIIRPRWVTTE